MICRALVLFVILATALGCAKEEQQTETEKLQGLHRFYFPDGTLYLEINYKDSLPHGLAKRYFKSGIIREEAEYRNGVQHGMTKLYYEDGKLSSIIPYDSGRIHGVKKKYRKDGSPAYEAPYHYGQPCVGLVELFLSGRPVDNYPTILVNTKDGRPDSNSITLEFSLSNKSEAVEYFIGELIDGKYISSTAQALDVSNGVGKLTYSVPDGVRQEQLNIVAKIKTSLGNWYITQTRHNVAIGN